MKRSVVALGLLGLVCAVALPAAHAAVLWQPDLSKDKLEGVNGIYLQGVAGDAGDRSKDTTLGEGPFLIDHDPNEVGPSGDPDTRKNGWLDGGASDNVSLGDGYSDIDGSQNSSGEVSAPWMLL